MKGVDFLFYFPTVTEYKNTELMTNLDIKKAAQSMAISTKLFEDFRCLFTIYIITNV